MERVVSQEDIARMWGLSRSPSEAAFQTLLTRVPSLTTLLHPGSGGNGTEGMMPENAHNVGTMGRVESMEMLRKLFTSNSGDMSQYNVAQQQAFAQQFAQVAQQQQQQQALQVQGGQLPSGVPAMQQVPNMQQIPNKVHHQQQGVRLAVPSAVVGGYDGIEAGSREQEEVDAVGGGKMGEGKPHAGLMAATKEDGKDVDGTTVNEIRRMRRMLSNRESARRSRRRKQDHLSELEGQIKALTDDSVTLRTMLKQYEKKNKDLMGECQMLRTELKLLRSARPAATEPGEELEPEAKRVRPSAS